VLILILLPPRVRWSSVGIMATDARRSYSFGDYFPLHFLTTEVALALIGVMAALGRQASAKPAAAVELEGASAIQSAPSLEGTVLCLL
jgi:hypothetical protein